MNDFTKAQLVAITIAPLITGCISAILSSTIITMILRSRLKLSTIYRRLIFAISVIDLILSLAQGISAFAMPAGTTWAAIGNDTTCEIVAFVGTVTIGSAIWYSLSLSIYFVSVIKFEMRETEIRKRVEPFLHAFPIIYSLAVSVCIYATHNYGSDGVVCWINQEAPILMWVATGFLPIFFTLIGNCILMSVIWRTVHIQSKKSQMYRPVHSAISTPISTQQVGEERKKSSKTGCFCALSGRKQPADVDQRRQFGDTSLPTLSPLAARLSRPSKATIRRLKDISNRAIAFIVGFILTYMFPVIRQIMHKYGEAPYVVIFLSRSIFPLQGLFNILVYTYPHVSSYLRNHPEDSWIRAFLEVIKSGGDDDQNRTSRRNRGSNVFAAGSPSSRRSTRNEPVVLDIDTV